MDINMVKRGTFSWTQQEEAKEIVIEQMPFIELRRIAKKIRQKIKEVKNTCYLSLETGDFKIYFISDETERKINKTSE